MQHFYTVYCDERDSGRNDALGRRWTASAAAYFTVLPRNLPVIAEGNYERTVLSRAGY
jgi:hypothetical protein